MIVLATAASVITLSTDLARSLGFQAADHDAEALKRQASEALERITAEQARRYGAKFQRTESLGRLLNHQAGDVLTHSDRPDPIRPPNLAEGPDGAMLTNGSDAPVSVVHFEGTREAEAGRHYYRSILESSPVAIGFFDGNRRIKQVNSTLLHLTGYTEDQVLGHTPEFLYTDPAEYERVGREAYPIVRKGQTYSTTTRFLSSEQQDAGLHDAMWHSLKEAGHWEGERWNQRKDGSVFPVDESISVVRGEGGDVQHYVAVFHDITEQKRLESELDYRTTHDPLTGLLNRKHLEQLIGEEINRAIRYGNTFSLIMFDFDHIKAINDRLGHHVGDRVLIHVGRMAAALLRESDHLGRWGGEELMILLPQTALDGAASLAERLRRTTAEAAIPDLPPVTISLGVSQYHPGDDLDDMTRSVDSALYRAKTQGRNRVERA